MGDNAGKRGRAQKKVAVRGPKRGFESAGGADAEVRDARVLGQGAVEDARLLRFRQKGLSAIPRLPSHSSTSQSEFRRVTKQGEDSDKTKAAAQDDTKGEEAIVMSMASGALARYYCPLYVESLLGRRLPASVEMLYTLVVIHIGLFVIRAK